ncbi:MAG: DUF3833 family protein [Rhodobacteraceae bacterium]|nr:DUF3833 family protein [Paracoccaceae bacterium]
MTFMAGAVALGAFLWLVNRQWLGFHAQKPGDYLEGPTFSLPEHLNGPMVCEGVIYGPMGRVVTRFVGTFEGVWDGDKGHLKEHFRYDSGTEQERNWYLTTHNDGTFDAEASDVVGTGQGVIEGSAVKLTYAIKLADAAGGHVLKTTDWMYLLDNGTIVNRSQMRTFGIKVAELVATIRKVDA